MAAWLPNQSRRGDEAVAEVDLVEEKGVLVCCLVDGLVKRPAQVAGSLQPQQYRPVH